MEDKVEQQPKNTLSRRSFLKKIGQLAAVAGITMLTGRTAHAQPEKDPSAGTSVTESRTTVPEQEQTHAAPREVVEHGVRIFYGADNLPTHYILPDGTKVNLEREKLLAAKEQAIKNREIEFVSITPLETEENEENEKQPTSPEHPVLNERPDNVLSEQELAKRGIKIFQSPQVEFFIRSAAFKDGGIFAGYKEGGDRKLNIVFLDSVVVAAPFATDERYREIEGYLNDPVYTKTDTFLEPNFIEDYKKTQTKLLANLRNQIESNNGNKEYASSIVSDVKEMLFKLEHLPKDQVLKLLAEKNCPRAGLYVPPYDPDHSYLRYPQKSKENPNTAVMFIAAGESVVPKEELKMFFNEDGTFKIVTEKNTRRSYLPTEQQSMPDPSKYTINPEANEFDRDSYPYGPQDVVNTIYHEGEHDVLVGEAIHNDEYPETSEFQTDMNGMQRVKNVWKRWKASGFTDDSESSFGFRLKNGKYIIFKRNTPPPIAA